MLTVVASTAMAQLPSGSISPDFTATDLDSVEHNLYSYLDSGYQVILDFSATWCPPCWTYHEEGVLKDLYNLYGPEGTNELRVFYIEGDDTTNNDDLNGTGSNTQGDWVSETPYPIIDNAGDIFAAFECTYFPTIYTICPNRILTESGQATLAGHESVLGSAQCIPASFPKDALLMDYVGQTAACVDNPAALAIRMMNNGLEPLTFATIEVSKALPFNAMEVIGSVDWQGVLETYEYASVELLDVVFDGSTTYVFNVVSPDDNEANNSTSGFVRANEEVTNSLRITLKTDGAPEQLGWELLSEEGIVVASVLPGTENLDPTTEYSWDVTTPDLGCFRLNLIDVGGDGLVSLATSMEEVGFLEVSSMDGDTILDQDLFYQELDAFSEVSFDLDVVDINQTNCSIQGALNFDPMAIGNSQSPGDLLYLENFDTYNNGDAITVVSPAFELWPGTGATDAFVTNEAQFSGVNSLKIEGQLNGGPMDVVLKAGLEGVYDISFKVLVPPGSSGYYNIQENIVAGIEWAFECHLNSDGTITYEVDPAANGPEFATTYSNGNWVEIKHLIDTDLDLMSVFIDGIWAGELPYDGEEIGGINFYATGDGVTLPLYFLDDISVFTIDNPGCISGCTDAEAINYDPDATVDDGTCVYFATSCEFIGHPAWPGLEAGLYSDSTLWHYQGAEAYGEWVLHMPELVVEPASGSSFAVMEWSNLTMSNMPPGLQPQNMPSLMMGGEQVCVSYSGIPSEVGLYPVLVSGELTVTLFGNPYMVGPYNVVGTIEVLPNPNPIAGCTYGNAANYVVYANVDDGSCVFAGCTEPEACNYQPLATVDDGTCDFGVCETVCPADVNGDGTVNTNDLLGLLGYFGLPCEE